MGLVLLSVVIGLQLWAIGAQSLSGDGAYHLLAGHQALRYGQNLLNLEHPPLVKLLVSTPLLLEDEPLAPPLVVEQALAESQGGWIITNPPWGIRLAEGSLHRLYASFGRTLRAEFGGFDIGLLCPEPALLRSFGLDFEEGPWLNNGGQHVQLVYAHID